jgi:hypothetical protein
LKRNHLLIITVFLSFANSSLGATPTPAGQATTPSAQVNTTAPGLDPIILIDPKKLKEAHASLKPPILDHRWSVFASVGTSALGSSRYVVNSSNSTLTTSDTASVGLMAGGGASYLINPIFQLAGEIAYSTYKISSGVGSDSDLLVMIVPRLQSKKAKNTLWAGIGTGFDITQLGNSPGNAATGSDFPASAMGIAVSPEIGTDYDLSKSSFIGAKLSYVFTSGELGQPVAGSLPTTENYNRRWAMLALTYGKKF